MEYNSVLVERDSDSKVPLFWLREEGQAHPFGYVQWVNFKWWAAIPGGDCCGYFDTRSQAIASLI